MWRKRRGYRSRNIANEEVLFYLEAKTFYFLEKVWCKIGFFRSINRHSLKNWLTHAVCEKKSTKNEAVSTINQYLVEKSVQGFFLIFFDVEAVFFGTRRF